MCDLTLWFKDGSTADCKILGSTTIDNNQYAVFLEEATKDVYIYKYMKKKKNKYRLFEITDENEFKTVCRKLNSLIGANPGGGHA